MSIFHLQHISIQTPNLFSDFLKSIVETVDSPTQIAPEKFKVFQITESSFVF